MATTVAWRRTRPTWSWAPTPYAAISATAAVSGRATALQYSGYGKKGTARYGVLVNGTATPSIGNIFAMSCAHCHNSGQQNFGGIHGAAGTYLSYSTNGMDVAGTTKAPMMQGGAAYQLNVTHKTSYRFMGGESNRYNGGATASKWEAQTINPLIVRVATT